MFARIGNSTYSRVSTYPPVRSVSAPGGFVGAELTEVPVEARALGRTSRVAAVAVALAFAIVQPATAQAVRGTVVDAATGEPVGVARVVAVDTLGEERSITMADTAGRFDLRLPEPGRYRFRTERLGYAGALSDPLTVRSGEIAIVALRVSADPVELDPITAVVRRQVRDARLDAWGFYERRERYGEKSGWGRFLEREEIERKVPTDVSDVFRGMPGVRVVGLGGRQRAIRVRGGSSTYGYTCNPDVYVDGVRLASGASVDDILPAAALVAVEVYTGMVQPPRFARRPACGMILLWTGFTAEEER